LPQPREEFLECVTVLHGSEFDYWIARGLTRIFAPDQGDFVRLAGRPFARFWAPRADEVGITGPCCLVRVGMRRPRFPRTVRACMCPNMRAERADRGAAA